MSEKIDINVADVETLTTISGIGPALAARIIEYRQTVHPFEEVIELTAVPGISEKMVRSFEDKVTVQFVTPVDLDVSEGTPLLDAPEERALLDAPAQPEALLPAELPEAAPAEVEEMVVAEVNSEPSPAEEAVMEEPITPDEEPAPEEANVPETAVSTPPAPEIQSIPLAGSSSEAAPDPDLIAAAAARQNADWERKAQRRGCLSTLLGATFGAILGMVLTLAVLAALNQGTLTYSASDSALRQQLNTEIISRTNELNQLSTRVSLAATAEAAANQTLQSDFEALDEDIASNEEFIGYLATRSGDLEQRIQEVAGAADTFTSFLDGLRALLGDLEAGTSTPTPSAIDETASPTPTPTLTPIGTNSPQPSATTAVSPTGAPTRTPLPTATPFTFPTNTPAPQP